MNAPTRPPSRADQVIARCRELALATEVEGETTRTFLAPSMRDVHALLGRWMRAAGLDVWVDNAGNVRGLLAASDPNAPRLLIGSHLDTVPNAGAFDGVLGVILGVSLAEEIASWRPLPFALEVIGFSEEEGERFGKPFLGSLALIGELDAEMLACTDARGVTVEDAIRSFNLDPEELPAAVVDPAAFAFVEFHIEQGPVLENANRALGVVDAIAGQTRMHFTFTGQCNHAGTTPMGALRRDALAAAAAWVVDVECYANAASALVATVGKLNTTAGAGNVIAGECTATLDVRHAHDLVRHAAVEQAVACARKEAAARGVTVKYETTLDQAAVPMDPELTAQLAAAAGRASGTSPLGMTSGAGHDAMIVARRLPSAMLFLRSPGGISHHPNESVLAVDVEAALATGLEFLRTLRDDRAMLVRLTSSRAVQPEGIHA